VVDCGDRTLLPGLIDSHVHLTMGGATTSRENVERLQREEPDTLALRAIGNALAVLRGGLTTARDCGGRDRVMVAVRRALERGLFTGPRLLVAGMPVTPTAGHCFWMGRHVAAHVLSSPGMANVLAAGVDTVEHVRHRSRPPAANGD